MLRALLALVMILTSVFVLEQARHGVDISRFDVGQTPVTQYARTDATGPVVVIAHGFAGSQQMMQGYALPLARAGYRVYVFEFLGHGRHALPMSGDVTSVDGTTRLLVAQTNAVLDAVVDVSRPVALLGHSMATDILIRAAQDRRDVGPMVLVSAFSHVIDATTPQDLLLVSGAWETGLRGFGLEAAQMVLPTATEGQTVRVQDVRRRAVAAPLSEHVSVLHSRVARQEALEWVRYVLRTDIDGHDHAKRLGDPWPIGWFGSGVSYCRTTAALDPLSKCDAYAETVSLPWLCYLLF